MMKVCLNYLALLRHELLLELFGSDEAMFSINGKMKKTEFWNLVYIKHTCPWNTAVLHDVWIG